MISHVDPKIASAVIDRTHMSPRLYGLPDHGYVGAADTARLIRSALKIAFPGVPFSVRSSNYSGGSSVRVSYTNGPSGAKVSAALAGFVGKGFDGMIDMAYSSDCYITRSGSIGFARTAGTAGSRGSVPSMDGSPVPYGAVSVSFGSYISVDRDRTDPWPDYNDHWARVAFDAMDLPPAPARSGRY